MKQLPKLTPEQAATILALIDGARERAPGAALAFVRGYVLASLERTNTVWRCEEGARP